MAAYRDDLEALSLRHQALVSEVATKTRELDASARLLSDAKARAKLPVLDNIRIAAPCSADWSKMTGDERVRACGDCNKNVYNLSDMTRDEAQALLIAKEGRLCVRYFQRADGTILTKDCAIGVSRNRRRRLVIAGAAVLLAGGGAVYRALSHKVECTPMGAVAMPISESQPVHEVKGDVAPALPFEGAKLGQVMLDHED